MSSNLPRIFQVIAADTACKAVLGTNPTRFFPYSRSPQSAGKPYATYSGLSASPENYINSPPDIDNVHTIVDIFAETHDGCQAVFLAVRAALERFFWVTSFSTPERDGETDLYHCSLDVDVWQSR